MTSLILEILFKSSVVLLVTLAAALLAQKQSAAFRHWIWTVGLVGALSAPILGMYLPAWSPQIATFAVDSVKRMNPVVSVSKVEKTRTAGTALARAQSGVQAQISRHRPSLQWVLVVWILGMLVLGSLLLMDILKLAVVAGRAKPADHRHWCDIAHEVSSTLRLKRSVKLVWNSGASVLGTWGTFRPRILLPREIESWSEERMRVVLAHELSHVKRNDWLLQLLAEAARVLYWFNPLFWLACARMRRESEFACDDAALGLGIDGPIYAGHLLDLVRTLKRAGNPHAAVLAMAGTSNLERRLVAMMNSSMNRRAVGKGTIAAIITLACALTLPIAAMQAKGSVPIVARTSSVVTVTVQPPVLQPGPAIPPNQEPARGNTDVLDQVAYLAPIQQTPAPAPATKPPGTVAIVVLVDVSGSMSIGQLTIAKEAAKASLKALRDTDRFGTLAFNTSARSVAPLQSAGNRDAIDSQIDTLYAGGGTNIYVGLNAAYEELKNASEDVKLVVLLSDGLTQTGDFQGLATTMFNAGITISSVTVGVMSNRMLMADLAMWGKGRAYVVNTYDRVPQILVKEAELAVSGTR